MWSKVYSFVCEHNLLTNNDLYLVALSGGADSVALLLLLQEAGYSVHAAHCNFRLRGAESDRDEDFCVRLCERLGVELHLAHFDTRTYAEVHRVSIEMAARELRYRWFGQLAEDIGAAGICVAHHQEDSVETVLLNLVRGTGLRGLCGIQPKNGRVLRPLLGVTRAEIERYLAEKGQNYVTDSTNLEADVQRNKVRLKIMPLLRGLNPAVCENIQRMTENLAGAQAVLDGVLLKYNKCNELPINDLCDNYSREYITFEWLKNYGFNGSQVRQVMQASTGSVLSSPKGFEVLKDREKLIVEPALLPMKPLKIPEEGTYLLSESAKLMVQKTAIHVSKDPLVATLDAKKACFPLTVRRVEEGDWMVPFGMTGRKLLSDLMTDRKMTLFEKRRQLVVVDAQGVTVWAIGLRTDARVAVSEGTNEVLTLRFEGKET